MTNSNITSNSEKTSITNSGILESTKENSRSQLTSDILKGYFFIITIAILITTYLVINCNNTIENSITFILAISSLFSGLMVSEVNNPQK